MCASQSLADQDCLLKMFDRDHINGLGNSLDICKQDTITHLYVNKQGVIMSSQIKKKTFFSKLGIIVSAGLLLLGLNHSVA